MGKIVKIEIESETWFGVKKYSEQTVFDKVKKSDISKRFETLPKAIQEMSDLTGEKKEEISKKYKKYFPGGFSKKSKLKKRGG
ncbi:MAG: hypothetical protein WC697_03055 [Patescibacteria group bacterium]